MLSYSHGVLSYPNTPPIAIGFQGIRQVAAIESFNGSRRRPCCVTIADDGGKNKAVAYGLPLNKQIQRSKTGPSFAGHSGLSGT